MSDTKICEHCGAAYERPHLVGPVQWSRRKYCSKACAVAGRPVGVRTPCRICGEPTRYYATDRRLSGLVTCGRPECAEASRVLKNERIGEAHRARVADGRHQTRKDGWIGVPLISHEETILADWFTALGWVSQHHVLTGVHTNTLPRMFRLDFALPDRMLYVEIDGSVHRSQNRRARDARRDAMLADLGWHGLRVPAKRVRDNPEAVKRAVLGWLSSR